MNWFYKELCHVFPEGMPQANVAFCAYKNQPIG